MNRAEEDLRKIIPLMKPDLTHRDSGLALLVEEPDAPILEKYAPDLFVSYAFDNGDHYELVARKHCQQLGIATDDLRDLSLNNLRRTLPPIERYGSGPTYMLVAGGNLESSLLLLDDLWESQGELVTGAVVVAVPARDVLLFTGEASPGGLDSVRASIDRLRSSAPDHPLTGRLFARRGREWRDIEADAV